MLQYRETLARTMMSSKPLLIGMNNPLSLEPGYELFPAPTGCTGYRIWQMLAERRPEVMRRGYIDTFERRNLCRGIQFSREDARRAAALVYAELWGTGRTVVLLGEDVRRAFGHPRLLIHPQLIGGAVWRQAPHPSGRNPWYNKPENRKMVGMLLEELYVAYHELERKS